MDNEKLVYLVDGTSFAYRAFYAIPPLTTSEGFPTNAVYGFVRMFLKLIKDLKPEYIAVAFDVGKKTFREEILKSYKANRKPAPDEFKVQLPWIVNFLKCLGVSILQKEGFEADDLLGTVAKKLSKNGVKVVIVTPDKDMMQLIDENVSVLSVSQRGGASKLYDLETFEKEFGYHPSKIPDIFALSGDPVDNIPGIPGFGSKTATSLIKEFGSLENIYRNINLVKGKRRDLLESNRKIAFISKELATISTAVPIDVNLEDLKLKSPDFDCLKQIILKLEMKSLVSELISMYPDFRSVWNHAGKNSEEIKEEELCERIQSFDLFSKPDVVLLFNGSPVIAGKGFYCKVKPEKVLNFIPQHGTVYVFDLKGLYHKLGDSLLNKPTFDLSIADYLLNPLDRNYFPKALLEKYLNIHLDGDISSFSNNFVEIGEKIVSKLKKENLYRLYREIEHPLSYVLYRMEKRGVLFDLAYLRELERDISLKILNIKKEIFSMVGEEFNINSPKQLSSILFKKLSIPPVKKTKSGFSTDVEVLTILSSRGYRIADLLLNYRKYSKLLGTFVRGLIKHADERGRVHTTFIQTGTATGRLSSTEPNLQNLPVYDDISRRIRHAVIAPEGFTLLWADYSQIELRVLAHLSQDEKLIEAFRSGRDIHRETASLLFGVSPESVSDPMRRVAKMVNFGVIYGMSPQGLSQRLGISFDEAENYIIRYFETFKGVKNYIESVLNEAYRKYFVVTLFGRKRPLPELRAKGKSLRNFGERAAFNAVIQGTAADIMKAAMLKLFDELKPYDSHMTLQVHDEILVEVPNGKVDVVKGLVKEVMEGSVNLSVPLKVDVKVGEHWD